MFLTSLGSSYFPILEYCDLLGKVRPPDELLAADHELIAELARLEREMEDVIAAAVSDVGAVSRLTPLDK